MKKPSAKNTLTLERSVSLFQATVYGVGIILGAGIYALIGEAVGIAGNAVWISFLVAALIAGCTAVSYAELSALYPKSAAEFTYVKEITGSPFLGFMAGYMTVITGVISVAAVALGFSSYFKLYMDVDPVLVGVTLIVAIAILNYSGIQHSARINTTFTFVEAGGLIFIIFIGLPYVGDVSLLSTAPGAETNSMEGIKPIMAAAALIFFAYQGFEDIANIAEETQSAETNVPLALLYSLLITSIIYVLVAIVAVSVVPGELLYQAAQLDNPTEGPLALVASKATQSSAGGSLFTIVALCATANTVLVLHIVSSRMMYGMARDNNLPALLGTIDPRTRTPLYAIIVTTILCVVFTLGGSIGDAANLTNVGVFLVFLMVNGALLIHRFRNRQHRNEQRNSYVRLAGNIGWIPLLPLLGTVFCAIMLVTQFWQPMSLFGFSVPIIVCAALMAGTAVPVYLLSHRLI